MRPRWGTQVWHVTCCGRYALAIPRIIHQTWKSVHVPQPFDAFQAAWRALHPTFEYRLWTDADNDRFVRSEFPELYALYRSFSREIYRADMARCLYLKRFGGVYVDLDIEPLRPLDALLSNDDTCILGAEPESHARMHFGKPVMACNAVMASVPGHPFWDRMLEEIQERAARPRSRREPVSVTGPVALDAAYLQHGARLGVRISSADAFFPLPDLGSRKLQLAPGSRKYYERMRSLEIYPPESYGVHHWAHTWIPEVGLNRALHRGLQAAAGAGRVLRGAKTLDELLRPARYGVQFPEASFPPRARKREGYERRVARGRETARGRSLTIVTLLHDRIDLALDLRARCEALLRSFGGGRVLVLGEDSTDGTERVLAEWVKARPGVVVSVPLPRLSAGVRGFARMAHLRNALLEQHESLPKTDFLTVLDGDLEGPVSRDGVWHSVDCLSEPGAPQGVTALGVNNYLGVPALVPFVGYGYYDPIAFREHRWERSLPDAAVRLRLAHLRRGDEPLAVRSAFAGLAIYQSDSVRGLRYDPELDDCEHVGFHRALARRGGRLVLNPSLLLLAGRQGHHRAKLS